MTSFSDPEVTRRQYATEANLRARQALWAKVDGESPLIVLWDVLSSLRPRNVLEVGGGQGELAERMQTELGADVTFIDQSERMAELARERGIDKAQVGDVQDLPFAEASFDTAVAAWMLYHVADIDLGLAELARVLEPGGRLVAVTNSVRHLEELRGLIGRVMPGFELDFNSENGEGLLRRHFARVERTDTELVATVDDRETLVGYQRSLAYDAGPIPEDVALPFRVHGRSTIFVATK